MYAHGGATYECQQQRVTWCLHIRGPWVASRIGSCRINILQSCTLNQSMVSIRLNGSLVWTYVHVGFGFVNQSFWKWMHSPQIAARYVHVYILPITGHAKYLWVFNENKYPFPCNCTLHVMGLILAMPQLNVENGWITLSYRLLYV